MDADQFLEVLGELRDGEAVLDFAKKFTDAKDHAVRTGSPATITLKLQFKRDNQDLPARVQVLDECKLVKTEPKRTGTQFYEHEDGAIRRRHPKQPSLPGMETAEEKADAAAKRPS